MRPVIYFVSGVGEHWEIRCRADSGLPEYPDRASAIDAATRAARKLWDTQHVASEVMVDGDDGRWIKVASFGELLTL